MTIGTMKLVAGGVAAAVISTLTGCGSSGADFLDGQEIDRGANSDRVLGAAPTTHMGASYVGCFKDTKARAIDGGFIRVGKDHMTFVNCLNHCVKAGARFMGVQDGDACFCGATYQTDGDFEKLADNTCNKMSDKCGVQFGCGHAWRNSVWNVEHAMTATFNGCYKDTPTRAIAGGFVRVGKDRKTFTKCLTRCTDAGAQVMGLQDGDACFCGTTFQADGDFAKVEDSDCAKMRYKCGVEFGCGDVWRNSIFDIVAATTTTTTTAMYDYFLALGGESCTQACESQGQQCRLDRIISAAESVDKCKSIIESLGFSPTIGGQFPEDNSGCTYQPDDGGSYKVMRKDADPDCDSVPEDASHQRACVCEKAAWTHVQIDDVDTWKSKFGITFEEHETEMRVKIFNDNTKLVVDHNAQKTTYWKIQNQFSHLTQEEFEKTLTYDDSQSIENSDFPVFEGEGEGETESEDGPQRRLTAARRLSCRQWSVSPVKNQGGCGSCWAFAAVAGMEGTVRVKLGRFDTLSEQQVMDCTSSSACSGGWAQSAYPQLYNKPLYTGASYPYTVRNGVCHGGTDSGLRISGFAKTVANRAGDAAMAIGLDGNPLVVTVDAGGWGSYGGGLFYCPKTSCTTNHQVLATGYDRYGFKIKNSWGTWWGEGGYIRLGRIGNQYNAGCGTSTILRDGGFYPIMSSSHSAPSFTPNYFLAPGGQSCTQACASQGKQCHSPSIASAAASVATCKSIINSLGVWPAKGGQYGDDNAGCTYHPGQSGWYQVMRRTGKPDCNVVNADKARRRMCACA